MIWLLSLICFCLPTYLIRFKIFGIPTTVLEVLIYISAITTVIAKLKNQNKRIKTTTKKLKPVSLFIKLKSNLRRQVGAVLRRQNLSNLKPSNILIPTVLLLLTGVISTIISLDKRTSLGILKGWFFDPILLGLLVALNVRTEEDFAKIVYGLATGGAVVSLWGILQWFGFSYLLPHQRTDSSFLSYLATGRAFGPFESPNYLGMYLASIASLTLGYWLKSEIRNPKSETNYKSQIPNSKNYLLAFCLAAMFLALLFTKSLGGWLGFGAGVAVLLFYFIRHSSFVIRHFRYISHISYFIFLISIIAACLLLINKLGPSRIIDSFAARKEVWQVSWYLIKQHPVLGIGLGMFRRVYTEVIPKVHFPPINWLQMHPHNIFLAFWLNLGLLGLISFIWILYLFFKNCFILLNHKSKIINPILTAAMLVILAHGLIDTTYWKNDLSAIFWVIVGLAFAKMTNDQIRMREK